MQTHSPANWPLCTHVPGDLSKSRGSEWQRALLSGPFLRRRMLLAFSFVMLTRGLALAEKPSPSPTPFVPYSDTGVFHVQNARDAPTTTQTGPSSAERDDTVTIYVLHLASWLNDPALKQQMPAGAMIQDLIPYLDDVPLKGVHPTEYFAVPEDAAEDSTSYEQVYYLRFTLSRTEASKDAWRQILDRPEFKRQMKVSVGFENGLEMQSFVLPSPKSPENDFTFTVIPPLRFSLGAALIVGALAVFVYLARWTDIIRDSNAPLRPDKRRPYSLSRTQMAFWFFLVIGAFFFLWIVLGDFDTLNPSVLGLMGISASTALAAAFVDASKLEAALDESDLPAVNLSQPRPKIRVEIESLITATKNEMTKLEAERGNIDPEAAQLLADNAAAQAKKAREIAVLQRQLEYFKWPAWKGVMFDLLAENDAISFHRFQIFVWTLALGIMFVSNIYNQLAMPAFSATLLGLLGLSGVTYVGFRLPDS